jgi:hypothetical protein
MPILPRIDHTSSYIPSTKNQTGITGIPNAATTVTVTQTAASTGTSLTNAPASPAAPSYSVDPQGQTWYPITTNLNGQTVYGENCPPTTDAAGNPAPPICYGPYSTAVSNNQAQNGGGPQQATTVTATPTNGFVTAETVVTQTLSGTPTTQTWDGFTTLSNGNTVWALDCPPAQDAAGNPVVGDCYGPYSTGGLPSSTSARSAAASGVRPNTALLGAATLLAATATSRYNPLTVARRWLGKESESRQAPQIPVSRGAR